MISWQKIALGLFAALWVPMIALVLVRLIGVRFIASPVSLFPGPSWIIWVTGAAIGVAAIPGLLELYENLAVSSKNHSLLIFSIVFAPILGGYGAVVTSEVILPVVLANLEKSQLSLSFVVVEPNAESTFRSSCRRRITVDTAVFGWSSLCGVPVEIRSKLQTGDVIVVSGTGSPAGIYYGTYSTP